MCHCNINILITIAIIGISAGIMAAGCFAFQYHNWSTTIMALISSAFASFVTCLHFSYKRNRMASWTKTGLRKSMYINGVTFVLSTAGMIGCLISAGIQKQTLTHDGLQGENLWMTAVWCFMTAKWSGQGTYFSRRYSAEILPM